MKNSLMDEKKVKKMSNSSLVSYTRISPNKNHPRKYPITKITIHHMAGNMSLQSFGSLVAKTSRAMSSNYAIDSKGNIGLFCDEEDRSWCSSSRENDNRAITIEVANDGGSPNWHVSDASMESLINLCVDICKRNGISFLNFTGDSSGNLTMHKMFSNTQCPGPYLESKFPYIASEVNRRLNDAVSSIYAGAKVGLNRTPIYISSSAKNPSGTKTGTYYIWSDEVSDGRIRITNDSSRVGVSGQVTGWINVSDLGISEEEPETPKVTLYKFTSNPMSKGDLESFKNLASSLKLSYIVEEV